MTTNDPRPDNSDSAAPNPEADAENDDRPRPYAADPEVYRPAVYGATPHGTTPYGATPHGTTPYGATPHAAAPYGTSPYGATPSGTGGFRPDQAYPAANAEPQYIPEHPAYAGYSPTTNYGQGYGSGGYGAYPPGGYPGYPAVPSYGSYAGGYAYPGGPQSPSGPSKKKRALMAAGAAALAVGLVLSGVAIAQSRNSNGTSQAQTPTINGGNDPLGGSTTGGGTTGGGTTGGGTTGNGTGGAGVLPGNGQNGQSTSAAVATKAQQVGVVTIVSVLSYQRAESAGTGMILTSDGEILTNNHVIDGATSIVVTVESTGKSYRADVVGTAPTKDVAVLKLRNASGLTPANVDQSTSVAVGDSVVGVGNAGGTGTLRAASGKVTALQQAITASDETGANQEKLTGLIETNAGIISGDSGGPLYDSSGQIVGMDTAASTANSSTQSAYAIPISTALSVANQIETGIATSVIHIGLPAFIGVTVLSTSTGGAAINTVVAGDPAADAGITAGSTITAVNGKQIADSTALKTALSAYQPGRSVSLTWTDASGTSHTAKTTLIAGPAD